MDKKTAGLLGAVAGLATMGSAHAAAPPAVNVTEAMQAASYADLLAPIENAVALVQADDATRAQGLQTVQYYGGGYDHHHHHHHHHHANYPGEGYGPPRYPPPARYAHHHHHHHHHNDGIVGELLNGR